MGSYIYIEFSRMIAPQFNNYGVVECEQDGEWAICIVESDQRIIFVTNKDLWPNKTEVVYFQ